MEKSYFDVTDLPGSPLQSAFQPSQNQQEEDAELEKLTDFSNISIEESYSGPHIKFPLTLSTVKKMIEAFKTGQVLHAKYTLQLLHEIRNKLKLMPNISQATTSLAKQITICGDLHGKIDDLFMIFYKNGLPSTENPYIFNGDFVDRGPNSVEIALLLFSFILLYPNEVYLNRGNHEDHIMNLRYGFIKEVMSKYRKHATKVVRLFEDVFSWLPLATIIDAKILVVHGGISDKTDLTYMKNIDRHKPGGDWSLLLKPGADWSLLLKPGGDWSLLLKPGADWSLLLKPGGDWSLLLKPGGDWSLLLKPGGDWSLLLKPGGDWSLLLKPGGDCLSIVEESAIRDLRYKIIANKSTLMEEFLKYDTHKNGTITVGEWAQCMSGVLDLQIPWRSFKDKLVEVDGDGRVMYETCVDLDVIHNLTSGPSITETLYRNKTNLETIFRIMDKDNSGQISMDEFGEACKILAEHINSSISDEQVRDMAKSIDMNKDGYIDFNEFLEAFRLVDPHSGKTLVPSRPGSSRSMLKANGKTKSKENVNMV
ncbi:serine/threonine-protein phosphatase with EF-hands pef-1-like [Saccoglossus kowalevskii]